MSILEELSLHIPPPFPTGVPTGQNEKIPLLSSLPSMLAQVKEGCIADLTAALPTFTGDNKVHADYLIQCYLHPEESSTHVTEAIRQLNAINPHRKQSCCGCFWRSLSPKEIIKKWEKDFEETITSQALSLLSSRENTDAKIQSIEALAHKHHLQLEDVPQDGNCFYAAIAKARQIPGGAKEVRKKILAAMQKNQVFYQELLENFATPFETVWNSIHKNGAWASQPEIVVAARALHLSLVIDAASFSKPQIIAQDPQDPIVVLGYIENCHYAWLSGKVPAHILDAVRKELDYNASITPACQ